MANKNFRSQFSYGYAVPVTLRAKISIGSSGAPTISSGTGMGISSILHNGAGDYSITLSDSYAALLGVQVAINSGTSAPAAPLLNIISETVATLSSPVLRVQFRDLTGAAADPASGEVLLLSIALQNSSTSY